MADRHSHQHRDEGVRTRPGRLGPPDELSLLPHFRRCTARVRASSDSGGCRAHARTRPALVCRDNARRPNADLAALCSRATGGNMAIDRGPCHREADRPWTPRSFRSLRHRTFRFSPMTRQGRSLPPRPLPSPTRASVSNGSPRAVAKVPRQPSSCWRRARGACNGDRRSTR